jgi:hypothetical protein
MFYQNEVRDLKVILSIDYYIDNKDNHIIELKIYNTGELILLFKTENDRLKANLYINGYIKNGIITIDAILNIVKAYNGEIKK